MSFKRQHTEGFGDCVERQVNEFKRDNIAVAELSLANDLRFRVQVSDMQHLETSLILVQQKMTRFRVIVQTVYGTVFFAV